MVVVFTNLHLNLKVSQTSEEELAFIEKMKKLEPREEKSFKNSPQVSQIVKTSEIHCLSGRWYEL